MRFHFAEWVDRGPEGYARAKRLRRKQSSAACVCSELADGLEGAADSGECVEPRANRHAGHAEGTRGIEGAVQVGFAGIPAYATLRWTIPNCNMNRAQVYSNDSASSLISATESARSSTFTEKKVLRTLGIRRLLADIRTSAFISRFLRAPMKNGSVAHIVVPG